MTGLVAREAFGAEFVGAEGFLNSPTYGLPPRFMFDALQESLADAGSTRSRVSIAQPREFRTMAFHSPYATVIWDYINRGMPLGKEGSLKPDEVYGVVAFLLWRNEIIADTAVMNARTLPRVRMPARDRFVLDNRRGGPEIR